LHLLCTNFGGNYTKVLSDITSNVRIVVTFLATESQAINHIKFAGTSWCIFAQYFRITLC